MLITKEYISPIALEIIEQNPYAQSAVFEVRDSIGSIVSRNLSYFVVNCSAKNCNGVVPIKEKCYAKLEEYYLWYREKPLDYLHNDQQKGGPIDVYKEFGLAADPFKVGLEFETGNISSAHRSMNKLKVGLIKGELDMAMLIMPTKQLSYYLTDRVSNYEELQPYFLHLEDSPFVVFGFDAEEYSSTADLLPKGRDGMSDRSIRKWRQ